MPRAEGINLSATLEAALAEQLRIRRRGRWRTENAGAVEAYNRDVDDNGTSAITRAASNVAICRLQESQRDHAGTYPLLLDVQSDLLEPLNTRVVVPLSLAAPARTRAMQALTPKLPVAGKEYVMVTPQLAGISMRELGALVDTLSSERAKIIGALDLLITGI